MSINHMIIHDPSNDVSQDVSCHLLMSRELAYNVPRLIFLDLSHNPPCCLMTYLSHSQSFSLSPTDHNISLSISFLTPTLIHSIYLNRCLSGCHAPVATSIPFHLSGLSHFRDLAPPFSILVSLYLHNSPDLSQFLTISLTIGSHYPILYLSLFLTLSHSITISHSHLTLPSLPWSLLWSPPRPHPLVMYQDR